MKKLVLLCLLFACQSLLAQDIFRLETKMGDKVFNDILVIDSYDVQGFRGTFKGSLTVPGVFTVKAENAVYRQLHIGKRLMFSITVNENNEVYTVNYELFSIDDGIIEGKILKDGEVIATITGSQLIDGHK